MALGFKKPIPADDPRLQGHETHYTASRGGWLKREPKPVPATPTEQPRR